MISFKRIDHVQVCIPMGEEEKAREFYEGVLGLKEIPKPDSLLRNGGMWYQIGDIQLHIGVEEMGVERSKRHPAFIVEDIDAARIYLESRGVKIKDDIPIPQVKRFSFFDPFGNRFELLKKEADN
jgi:catechol 2,3-dioxygenase-like lactoylglutathione lyase family enzyme